MRNATEDNWVAQNSYERTNSQARSTDYYRLNGTSMSAALVSGAAALIAQKDPSGNPGHHQSPADERRLTRRSRPPAALMIWC